MIRHLLALLISAALALHAPAAVLINPYRFAAAAAGYAFTETFEGSTADSQSQVGCDNAGWVSSTSANTPHGTAAPAPLVGTFSLLMANPARTYIHDLPAAGGTTVGFYCRIKWSGTQSVSGSTALALLDSGSTIICRLESREGGGLWRLTHGTTNSTTTTFTVDTEYHIWIEYSKGTGANGAARLYVSSNATKPGAATLTITTGTATADVAKIRLSALSNNCTFDNVVVDGTQYIGSNPV